MSSAAGSTQTERDKAQPSQKHTYSRQEAKLPQLAISDWCSGLLQLAFTQVIPLHQRAPWCAHTHTHTCFMLDMQLLYCRPRRVHLAVIAGTPGVPVSCLRCQSAPSYTNTLESKAVGGLDGTPATEVIRLPPPPLLQGRWALTGGLHHQGPPPPGEGAIWMEQLSGRQTDGERQTDRDRQTETETNRDRQRQTARQTGRQTDSRQEDRRQTDRQAGRQAGRQVCFPLQPPYSDHPTWERGVFAQLLWPMGLFS